MLTPRMLQTSAGPAAALDAVGSGTLLAPRCLLAVAISTMTPHPPAVVYRLSAHLHGLTFEKTSVFRNVPARPRFHGGPETLKPQRRLLTARDEMRLQEAVTLRLGAVATPVHPLEMNEVRHNEHSSAVVPLKHTQSRVSAEFLGRRYL
jgi:hypothetical protein